MTSNKVFWITGLSGAGKSTIALLLKDRLIERGVTPILIDGDTFREILGDRFGYSDEERLYLAECYGRFCKTLSDQNHTVICATISMFDSVRKWNRKNIKNYFEIYLNAPPEILKERDPKGLYQNVGRTTKGKLVGYNAAFFEEPRNPDLTFNACNNESPELIVSRILNSM